MFTDLRETIVFWTFILLLIFITGLDYLGFSTILPHGYGLFPNYYLFLYIIPLVLFLITCFQKKRNYFLIVVMFIGIIWLTVNPIDPWDEAKIFFLHGRFVRNGMTKEEVYDTMEGYSTVGDFEEVEEMYDEGIFLRANLYFAQCRDDRNECYENDVRVKFAKDASNVYRVIEVWFGTE